VFFSAAKTLPTSVASLVALALMLAACGVSSEAVEAVMALTGEVAAGELLYLENCADCHLEDGSGDRGPSLIFHVPKHPDRYLVDLILGGKGDMPAFDELGDQDVADVLAYLRGTFGEEE
jgi:mono/diheme cytochrome c family protein